MHLALGGALLWGSGWAWTFFARLGTGSLIGIALVGLGGGLGLHQRGAGNAPPTKPQGKE